MKTLKLNHKVESYPKGILFKYVEESPVVCDSTNQKNINCEGFISNVLITNNFTQEARCLQYSCFEKGCRMTA